MQLFDRTLGQWLEHWAEETLIRNISYIPTAISVSPGASSITVWMIWRKDLFLSAWNGNPCRHLGG